MTAPPPDNFLPESYLQRFGGIARLYGMDGLRALHSGHFVVVGIGGVGSWAAEALVRTGLGAITLVDMDDICITNSNRQLHTTKDTIGQPKTAVLAQRLQAINPDVRVIVVDDFAEPENLAEVIPADAQVVIDAIDASYAKAALIAHCRRQKQQVVTVGSAGGRSDPSKVTVGDLHRSVKDSLLSRVRTRLRDKYNFPKDPKRNMRVQAVFSTEQMKYPAPDGSVCQRKQHMDEGVKLDCSGGFGSSTMVTATFGMVAAARAVDRYLERV
ncbi:tRNA cyclic N6-threonylcarbamoyladenosine(37) synthase TcdA [Porticoccus sp. W117]|uniref:tRNA cyclic N6-threonylcarbamoyladenosine(37) synthase TcdA n=1 Tax=Porticoccus sp. W117 TaxID=3054777 RepID=UPI002594100A|nr:tRNA cyclic N6-threonylcarbamoyladenosine(37) synthase TcdA [Porticoccus sp. W117]MDM3871465.1 tRNA cyclic N6-threonylcarbamoyladenosine(37) synthase TcdA [Porticoccus sp. W117]